MPKEFDTKDLAHCDPLFEKKVLIHDDHYTQSFLDAAKKGAITIEPTNEELETKINELNITALPDSVKEIIWALINYYLLVPIIFDNFDELFKDLDQYTIHKYRRKVEKILKLPSETRIEGNSYKAVIMHTKTLKKVLEEVLPYSNDSLSLVNAINNLLNLHFEKTSKYDNYNDLPTNEKVSLTKEISWMLATLFEDFCTVFEKKSAQT